MSKEIDDLKAEVDRLKEQKQIERTSYIRMLQSGMERLEKECDSLKAEVEEFQKENKCLCDSRNNLAGECQSLRAEVEENKKTIQAMDLIRQQQNREIADLQKELDRALARWLGR